MSSKTKIPLNEEYTSTIGKAVYMFSYYEWTLIYIIDLLVPGFVQKYTNPPRRPLTSGAVKMEMDKAIKTLDQSSFKNNSEELQACSSRFGELIKKRNALIHAHPITGKSGDQILLYRSNHSKSLSTMRWTTEQVEEFIEEIDESAVISSTVFHKLRNACNQ